MDGERTWIKHVFQVLMGAPKITSGREKSLARNNWQRQFQSNKNKGIFEKEYKFRTIN